MEDRIEDVTMKDDATSEIGRVVNGVEAPIEYFAALIFLMLDEESPYRRKNKDELNKIVFDVATALSTAKGDRVPYIKQIIDAV